MESRERSENQDQGIEGLKGHENAEGKGSSIQGFY